MTKKELDFLIRDSNANCIIRSNNIEIVKDPAWVYNLASK